eukprot:CAMPEP_0185787768 /NCGR_PEP_ID=MMETSP1174-20130828/142720_1 /TAXON_ID=35687 /ORGANISM="Dictyocha speculum, Strain CCMP1381" /LENGTH=90 /DNA_ID=CAMNT_0028481109 /DNA_START=1 /DNA_END=270 /DNA_ORIENTATION=-
MLIVAALPILGFAIALRVTLFLHQAEYEHTVPDEAAAFVNEIVRAMRTVATLGIEEQLAERCVELSHEGPELNRRRINLLVKDGMLIGGA